MTSPLEQKLGVPEPDRARPTGNWVETVGTITTCEHGHVLVKNWHFNPGKRVQGPLDWLDELVLAYPESVLHAPLPLRCPACRNRAMR